MISMRKGFTISELMVSAFMLILVIVISISITVSLNTDYKILFSYLSSTLKGREIIDAVSKDLRIAIRVMDSYNGYTTADSTIALKVPSLDTSGQILDIDNDFDYIIYRISGGDLWKTVIPGSGSSRPAYDGVFKKDIESLYMESGDTPLSDIAHKSVITTVTLWLSINETILGKNYRIIPGTTVKLMNYEWGRVR